MRTVNLLIRSEAPIEDSARGLMYLLDTLIDDLNKELLELPPVYTNLDEKMYRLRNDDMVKWFLRRFIDEYHRIQRPFELKLMIASIKFKSQYIILRFSHLPFHFQRTISDEAKELRENAVDLESAMEEIENFKRRLHTIAVEVRTCWRYYLRF